MVTVQDPEGAVTAIVLWVTGIGVVSAAVLKVWRGLRKVSDWMNRVETSVKRTEQRTNGDLDAKFADVRRDITDLGTQVHEVRSTLERQDRVIATMSGEIAVLLTKGEHS